MTIESSEHPQATERANRRSAMLWGSFVVGFLALQLVLGFSAVVLATADPSVAVVPEYYSKALDWDNRQVLRSESENLDWDVALANDGNDLRIGVLDSDGNPVKLVAASVSIYRHARASKVFQRRFGLDQLNQNGLVSWGDIFHQPGLWQVELDLINQDEQRYVDSLTMNIKRLDR